MLILGYVIITISCVLTKRTNNSNPTTAKPFSDLLHKFHQNDYKLAFERTEFVRSDPSFGDFQFHTFKYNRSTAVVNASFIMNVDMGYDTEIIGQVYKFASNEYRLFPIHCEVNFCEALATGAMGIDKFSKCGNIVCPIAKGKKYYYCNWAPEEARFPPLIPTGSYMLELQYLYHSKEFLVTYSYGTVYRPIA